MGAEGVDLRGGYDLKLLGTRTSPVTWRLDVGTVSTPAPRLEGR
jgi:hypothetical protein